MELIKYEKYHLANTLIEIQLTHENCEQLKFYRMKNSNLENIEL